MDNSNWVTNFEAIKIKLYMQAYLGYKDKNYNDGSYNKNASTGKSSKYVDVVINGQVENKNANQ